MRAVSEEEHPPTTKILSCVFSGLSGWAVSVWTTAHPRTTPYEFAPPPATFGHLNLFLPKSNPDEVGGTMWEAKAIHIAGGLTSFPTRLGIFRCCRRHLPGVCALLCRGSRWRLRLPQTPGSVIDVTGAGGMGGWLASGQLFSSHSWGPLACGSRRSSACPQAGSPARGPYAAGRRHVARCVQWIIPCGGRVPLGEFCVGCRKVPEGLAVRRGGSLRALGGSKNPYGQYWEV